MRQSLLFLILVQGYIVWGELSQDQLTVLSLMEMDGLVTLAPLEASLTEKGRTTIESSKISPADIKLVVDLIRRNADDDAYAHEIEDMLSLRVLSAISQNRCTDPAACALATLASRDISFERHQA